jgi:hypothetical protein
VVVARGPQATATESSNPENHLACARCTVVGAVQAECRRSPARIAVISAFEDTSGHTSGRVRTAARAGVRSPQQS